MASKLNDPKEKVSVGFTSGALTVIGLAPRSAARAQWMVRCECGVEKPMRAEWLRSGRVKSCGCMRGKLSAAAHITHGMSGTKEYEAWCDLKGRCLNIRNKEYFRYGGRGIKVCERWLNSFEKFFADMGECPESHEIDRRSVDGDYEPSNCRWVPYITQMRNLRTTKLSMEKARAIRKFRIDGVPYRRLREMFGILDGTISAVIKNRIWKEESGDIDDVHSEARSAL